jgi:hypothetical protein
MKLIGTDNDGKTLVFSARPRFGTQDISMKSIIELEQVSDNSLVYVSWKINSRTPPEKWRYQR